MSRDVQLCTNDGSDMAEKIKLVVCWSTKDEETIRRIRQRFGMPKYTTINGWTPAEILEEDMPLLEETARRGFISILRHIKWCKNGGTYSFISR